LCAERRKVRSEDPAIPVDDGIEAGGGAETIGVIDHPAGEDASPGTPSDEEIALIDVTFGQKGIDAGI